MWLGAQLQPAVINGRPNFIAVDYTDILERKYHL